MQKPRSLLRSRRWYGFLVAKAIWNYGKNSCSRREGRRKVGRRRWIVFCPLWKYVSILLKHLCLIDKVGGFLCSGHALRNVRTRHLRYNFVSYFFPPLRRREIEPGTTGLCSIGSGKDASFCSVKLRGKKSKTKVHFAARIGTVLSFSRERGRCCLVRSYPFCYDTTAFFLKERRYYW